MNGYQGKRSLNQDRTIYAFAHVESWLESYAKSTNQPAAELCTRVGSLLLAQGEGVGDTVPQPRVQGYSTRARVPVGKVEMAEHSHGGVYGRREDERAKEARVAKIKSKWTPAMRRAASKRMKKVQAKLQAARRAAALNKAA